MGQMILIIADVWIGILIEKKVISKLLATLRKRYPEFGSYGEYSFLSVNRNSIIFEKNLGTRLFISYLILKLVNALNYLKR